MQELKKKEQAELDAVLGELGIELNTADADPSNEPSEAALKRKKKREKERAKAHEGDKATASAAAEPATDAAPAAPAEQEVRHANNVLQAAHIDLCIAVACRCVCLRSSAHGDAAVGKLSTPASVHRLSAACHRVPSISWHYDTDMLQDLGPVLDPAEAKKKLADKGGAKKKKAVNPALAKAAAEEAKKRAKKEAAMKEKDKKKHYNQERR